MLVTLVVGKVFVFFISLALPPSSTSTRSPELAEERDLDGERVKFDLIGEPDETIPRDIPDLIWVLVFSDFF